MRLFFLLFPVVISLSYCKVESEPDLTSRWMLFENILRKFIGSQASITVFDIDKDQDLLWRKSTIHKVLNKITPLLVYGGLNETLVETINDMGNEFELPSTSKSYYAISKSPELIKQNLKLFSKVNTNGKWIFSLIQVNADDIKSLLITAWIRFRMTNILILFSDNASAIFIMSFNPFQLKEEDQHGEFYTEEVNLEKLPSILDKLERIFERKVENLQKYPLKAYMSKSTSDMNRILDLEMRKVFEKTLKTKFIVFMATTNNRIRPSNDSSTGIFRKIDEGETDIALNNRLVGLISCNSCAFLHPVATNDLNYLILKAPKPKNLLHVHVLEAFDWTTRFAYLAAFVIIGLVWHFLNILRSKISGYTHEREDFFKLATSLIGIQSSVVISMTPIKQWHQRVLMGSLLIFMIITCTYFNGTILNKLTHPKKAENIDTLHDLLESDLNLTALISVPDLFKPNENGSNVNNVQLRLYQRQKVFDELSVEKIQASGFLHRPKQAVLMRQQNAVDLINHDFDHETGESIYHIVKESPISYFMTYIVPKSSPFISTLNGAILSASEFGFLSFVNLKIKSYLDINRLKRYMKNSMNVRPSSAITMGNMRNIFIFYLVCITVSFIVFLIEILHKKFCTQRPTLPFVH